jgi:mannose-1-phosphate guanylyltransferase
MKTPITPVILCGGSGTLLLEPMGRNTAPVQTLKDERLK